MAQDKDKKLTKAEVDASQQIKEVAEEEINRHGQDT